MTEDTKISPSPFCIACGFTADLGMSFRRLMRAFEQPLNLLAEHSEIGFHLLLLKSSESGDFLVMTFISYGREKFSVNSNKNVINFLEDFQIENPKAVVLNL